MDLALNNLQRLIFYKTQRNVICKHIYFTGRWNPKSTITPGQIRPGCNGKPRVPTLLRISELEPPARFTLVSSQDIPLLW